MSGIPHGGEQRASGPIRMSGTDDRLAQESASLSKSTTFRTQPAEEVENSHSQILESKDENKTSLPLTAHTEGGKNHNHTTHSLESGVPMLDRTDSPDHGCSETAIPHNTQTSRSDLDSHSYSRDTSSSQNSGGTPDTLHPFENFDLVDHSAESKTEEDSSSGETETGLLVQNQPHNDDIEIPFALPRQELYCTCKVVSIDHFATFPPALIEPCILAGSRPGDLVLDPFTGSSTTGQVAMEHGRNYIGLDLKPEYLQLGRARFDGMSRHTL
jgi:hypothetical protein